MEDEVKRKAEKAEKGVEGRWDSQRRGGNSKVRYQTLWLLPPKRYHLLDFIWSLQ